MPKNIFIVTTHAGSAANFRGPLIRTLVQRGCLVRVLAPDFSPETRSQLQIMGASCEGFPMDRAGASPMADLQGFFKLKKIFSVSKPDVILTYFVKPNVWGILAAAWASVPMRIAIVEGMGFAFTKGSSNTRTLKQIIFSWIILCLYKLAFIAASHVFVLNSDDLQDLQDLCVLNPRKAILLGGIGVPLDEWKELPSFCFPITFVMVSRLLREKGVFEFLNAAKAIKLKYPETRFLLLGGLDDNPGSIQEADLQPWISKGIIDWLGHVNVKAWLAISSVFILPSYREGVPRSTQEAMALGRAVITTDVPGCRQTVVQGVNGFLVPPRNSEALAEAMEHFIRHPYLINTMGRESRRLAEQRFDANKVNVKFIEVMNV